jgi:hypothetical protein
MKRVTGLKLSFYRQYSLLLLHTFHCYAHARYDKRRAHGSTSAKIGFVDSGDILMPVDVVDKESFCIRMPRDEISETFCMTIKSFIRLLFLHRLITVQKSYTRFKI